jgi:hypothetical protein
MVLSTTVLLQFNPVLYGGFKEHQTQAKKGSAAQDRQARKQKSQLIEH